MCDIKDLPADDGKGRDRQKAHTRARVVAAARALFAERGYAATTIREIAKRARVASGSVFTTFESKAEILHEIMYARYAALFPAIADAVAKPGDAQARLRALAEVAYDFDAGELRLTAEIMSASWTWPHENEFEHRRRIAPLLDYMGLIIQEGVDAGEIDARVDVNLVVELLFGVYTRNIRRAVFDGWDAGQLAAHYARQVELLLRGCSGGERQSAPPA